MSMNSRNIKLTIAYAGYNYHGWQFQPDYPTIQEEVEKAIKLLTRQDIKLNAASRTDAGVSALGQVVNFVLEDCPVPIEKFPKALNVFLPDQISIVEAQEVGLEFNARFDSLCKEYQYVIFTGKSKPVLDINHCWHFTYKLDIEAMQKAASLVVGTKDFKCFSSAGDHREETTRTIIRCAVEQKGDWFTVTVEGNSFLYNMVRNIVGTIVDIGRGKWPAEYMTEIIASKQRKFAGILAPAQGLCLNWIKYPTI